MARMARRAAAAYRFRYRSGREYRLHGAAGGLLYARVLDTGILDWLSGFPDLWSPLLFVLAGQNEHAGVLGELVVQADQASVAQSLGGDPAKALTAPRHALQRKLLEGLRYLLREQLQINQPQASDGWLTQDALWLVSKTVSTNSGRTCSAKAWTAFRPAIRRCSMCCRTMASPCPRRRARPSGGPAWRAKADGRTPSPFCACRPR